MNYTKLLLVGFVSAFVAVLTYVLGVTGTIIGSVISSVLYNMLTEALEKPVDGVSLKDKFEWEVAYVFPLVVIALIQLLFIFAIFSELELLPYSFLNAYLSLQDFADNNLYRILGFALLIISVYPLILKPDYVKKSHGLIIAFVGFIFLARGFVDFNIPLTEYYRGIFANFDLPIAIITFILLIIVIVRILYLAKTTESDSKNVSPTSQKISNHHVPRPRYRRTSQRNPGTLKEKYGVKQQKNYQPKKEVRFRNTASVDDSSQQAGINESSNNIQFESNDLLDDYKK